MPIFFKVVFCLRRVDTTCCLIIIIFYPNRFYAALQFDVRVNTVQSRLYLSYVGNTDIGSQSYQI